MTRLAYIINLVNCIRERISCMKGGWAVIKSEVKRLVLTKKTKNKKNTQTLNMDTGPQRKIFRSLPYTESSSYVIPISTSSSCSQ